MGSVRCPVVVGRTPEREELVSAWQMARAGSGSAVAVVGPPGIGKSRLVRELVRSAGSDALALVGRAVADADQPAFRALSEALLVGLRDAVEPASTQMGAFGPVLGQLLPQWRPMGVAESSAVVLGEAVIRLLRMVGSGRPVLLVLEDLHWADPDTLAVAEYLADNCAGERLLIVVTCRTAVGPAGAMTEQLAQRGSLRRIVLGALSDGEVTEMVAACTGAPFDPQVVELVRARAEGVPLLIEDLLAAAERAGPGHPVIPEGVAQATLSMLAALPPVARRCVEAAAVVGDRVDCSILSGVIGADGCSVIDGLRNAVRAGILDAAPDGRFPFRHALTRDAVVDALLPPERAVTARRALEVVRSLDDGGDDWSGLAAGLAETAGEPALASELLVRSGRRALARGALATAESVLVRAVRLAGADPARRADAAEALVDVLVQAGHIERAAQVTDELLRDLARLDAPPERVAAAHVRLARAWTVIGSWSAAEEHVQSALAATTSNSRLASDADLVASLVAFGRHRYDEARQRAQAVLERLGDRGEPELRCEALEIQGRLARRRDLTEAERCFAEALRIAERAGMPMWQVRALHELSTVDLFDTLRSDRAERAAREADGSGAVVLATTARFHQAAILCWRGEYDQAQRLLAGCESACRAIRLPLLSMVLVFQAQIAAERGEADVWRTMCREAVERSPGDAHVALAADHVEATHLLLREDRRAAMRSLDRVAARLREDVDTTSGPPLGRWVLVATLERGEAALAEVESHPGRRLARWTAGHLGFARAVVLGRNGRSDEAARAFAEADEAMAEPVALPHLRHMARRLVAEAAVADGWGEPASWLRADLLHFEQAGHHRVAGACRDLLRRAGQPVPRAHPAVPAALRAQGVTAREAEVLRLIGEGLSNREMAHRLYISPRTVEKHVERLLTKTGMPTRAALVAHVARTR